jgi:hypothetical protein
MGRLLFLPTRPAHGVDLNRGHGSAQEAIGRGWILGEEAYTPNRLTTDSDGEDAYDRLSLRQQLAPPNLRRDLTGSRMVEWFWVAIVVVNRVAEAHRRAHGVPE